MHRLLENALKQHRAGVSWLIGAGSDARVRREVDDYLTKLFCDEGTGCMACPGCRKYTSGTHPDIRIVDGTKVDDVRGLSAFAAKHAFEGDIKAISIPRTDLLTEQAQNALLKIVEEPPDDTIIVLGAVSMDAVLPTIQSRCTVLEAPADGADAADRIAAETGLSVPRAQTLVKAAGGDYEAARALNEQDFFAVRDDAVQAMHRLIHARSRATSRIEKLLSGKDGKLELALRAALLYLQDVAAARFGLDSFVNADLRESITDDASVPARSVAVSIMRLHELAEKIRVCKGLNKRLALQGTLLNILEDIV